MDYVKRVIKKIYKTFRMPEMQVLPGQLAFFFLLSAIPIIALLGYLGIYFSLSFEEIASFVEKTFPKEASNLILPVITGKTFNFNMLLFFITAFIMASNGAYSIIIVSNTIYKLDCSSSFKRRIKSIIMTVFIVTLIIFLLLIPTFGTMIINLIGRIENMDRIMSEIKVVFEFIKWPISLIFIFFNIKLIYTMAPDKKVDSKNTTKGALFTTVLWILIANFYASYLSTFTNYDIFYGSISNLIILLLWVYILSYIFVMGLAINNMNECEEGI